jgi:hypothetical protein
MVVEAIAAQIRGKKRENLYVLIQGRVRISPESRIRIAFLTSTGEPVSQEVTSVGEGGHFQVALGPYGVEFPGAEGGQSSYQYLQAGVYTISAQMEVAEENPDPRTPIEARFQLEYPREEMDSQRIREREWTTSILQQLVIHFRRCERELEGVRKGISQGTLSAEFYAEGVRRWAKLLDQGIRSYRRFLDRIAGPVRDRRYRIFKRYVVILEELRVGLQSATSPEDALQTNSRSWKRSRSLLQALESRLKSD